MAAKLRVVDPNGKVVFDSTKDRVMSFLKEDVIIIPFPEANHVANWTHRIYHPRLNPERGFVYAEFQSIESSSLSDGFYGSDMRVEVNYGQGYADVIFPSLSTYRDRKNSLTYKIKAYTL